jgi:cyclic pyranopterin phosphate synthase
MTNVTELTHFDADGNAVMVDVSGKTVTERVAVAEARVIVQPETMKLIVEGGMKKGDVLGVARLAGIMGAKRTPDLIPLCHPVGLSSVTVNLRCDQGKSSIVVTATCRVVARTGVEMEALTAAAVASLTVYDMCKAVDRSIRITDLRLVHKSGGRSGTFDAP